MDEDEEDDAGRAIGLAAAVPLSLVYEVLERAGRDAPRESIAERARVASRWRAPKPKLKSVALGAARYAASAQQGAAICCAATPAPSPLYDDLVRDSVASRSALLPRLCSEPADGEGVKQKVED